MLEFKLLWRSVILVENEVLPKVDHNFVNNLNQCLIERRVIFDLLQVVM
jgi:hypothetical protein